MRKTSEEEIDRLIEENARRRDEIFGDYDPLTGVGCYDYAHRVKVSIPDFFIPTMYVPKKCTTSLLYKNVLACGSIRDFITDYWQKEYKEGTAETMRLVALVSFELCRVRFREDPEFAMYLTDKIEDKTTGDMIRFRLNYPQRRLLATFEDMRTSGMAIRVIILKARQWGGSTLTQLYIKWMQDYHHDGWNAIILSQVKGTSKKIKAMYRKALESQPGWTIGQPGVRLRFSPYENSPDDFIVTDGTKALRRSTLTVASFDTFDSVRGSNFHCAHYSEVAYWKKTPEHDPEGVISSISAGIRNQADNIEVFESTGRGASGFFYDKCQLAMNPDNNDAYRFLFIPFYIIENDMERVEDERGFARWLLENKDSSSCPRGYRETGKYFWRMWEKGACFDAINWYRNFRNKFKTHAFAATEAPLDEEEAFRNSGNLVFNPYSIADMRKQYVKRPLYYADIVLRGNRGGQMLRDSHVKIRDDGGGEMKIWSVPNNNVLHIRNRYVVSVDIGGKSETADYTVMTVIDRKGMMPTMNGRMSVAARWRGHCRHDVLAWKAAALARYYDNALLVIESNTADRERGSNTEGDHFGTIIEEIADYYDNLYQRGASSEDVSDKPLGKYGFQTNKITKGWLIDNLEACVDDMLWEEPDAEMYHELRIYERKPDGRLGNIEGAGNHDDVLMSTAIGLWVSATEMEKPEWQKSDGRFHGMVGDRTEAVI